MTRYHKRISGLLMDRVDIHMQVPRVEFQKLCDMRLAQIRKYCALDDACQVLMKPAMRQLQLTVWAYHLALKLTVR